MKRKHKNRNREAPRAALRRLQRPHPDGNVFDSRRRKRHAQGSLCRDRRRRLGQDRYVNKFAIRTPNAENAHNSMDVFELER